MDFTYSIWILLLPLISFLVIGLPEFVNKKYAWSHKTAGLIGTCSLGLVTILSYFTAFQYFTAYRLADGTYATFVPYNVTWLPLGHLLFIVKKLIGYIKKFPSSKFIYSIVLN